MQLNSIIMGIFDVKIITKDKSLIISGKAGNHCIKTQVQQEVQERFPNKKIINCMTVRTRRKAPKPDISLSCLSF